MNCKNCGAEVKENDRFCHMCGKAIENNDDSNDLSKSGYETEENNDVINNKSNRQDVLKDPPKQRRSIAPGTKPSFFKNKKLVGVLSASFVILVLLAFILMGQFTNHTDQASNSTKIDASTSNKIQPSFKKNKVHKKNKKSASHTKPTKQDLIRAVHNQDVEEVKTILKGGIKPDINTYADGDPSNKTAANSSTLLIDAIMKNNVPIVKALLDAGADPNFTGDHSFNPPLWVAVENGKSKEIIKMLINAGAKDMDVTVQEESLLTAAVGQRQTDVVQLLLDNGADPDLSPDELSGTTPLIMAAGSGDYDICKLLLKAGADPLRKDADGNVAYYYAMKNKHESIMELIYQNTEEPAVYDSDEFSPDFTIEGIKGKWCNDGDCVKFILNDKENKGTMILTSENKSGELSFDVTYAHQGGVELELESGERMNITTLGDALEISVDDGITRTFKKEVD